MARAVTKERPQSESKTSVEMFGPGGESLYKGTVGDFSAKAAAIAKNRSAAHLTDLYAELGLPGSAATLFHGVPHEDDFNGNDFLPGEEKLRPLFHALVDRFHDEFFHLKEAEVRLFWKKTGGMTGGRATLGKCQKASGLIEFYSDANYIIWLAADHLLQMSFTNWQVLALLYHEMRHTVVDDKGKFGVQGHDFEGFFDELETFGGWDNSAEQILRSAQKTLQPGLFD
jgi:hypothetical protein